MSHSRRAVATILEPDHGRGDVSSTQAWVLDSIVTDGNDRKTRDVFYTAGTGAPGEDKSNIYDDDEVQRDIVRAHVSARSGSRDNNDVLLQVKKSFYSSGEWWALDSIIDFTGMIVVFCKSPSHSQEI